MLTIKTVLFLQITLSTTHMPSTSIFNTISLESKLNIMRLSWSMYQQRTCLWTSLLNQFWKRLLYSYYSIINIFYFYYHLLYMDTLYQLLLSFIPPSYMIASNREIVNINLSSTMFNLLRSNIISKNIYMSILRKISNISSPNLLKELSAHSSIFLILYKDYIEAQNNDPS